MGEVKAWNRYADARADRLTTVTAKEWAAFFSRYPDRARYDAANLAAHNWDVTSVGDRILVSCAWSGGHWWNTEGQREAASDEYLDGLYPLVAKHSRGATTGFDKQPRQSRIVEEALAGRAPLSNQEE